MGPWQSREGSYVFAGAFLLSNCVLRDCHIGLRPPRNDKSGAFTIVTATGTIRSCGAGRSMPLPYKARAVGESARKFAGAQGGH